MKLLQKGLMLAAAPLILELIMLSSLAHLYRGLESEALRAEVAARKLNIVNGITRETYAVMRRIRFSDLEQSGEFKADYRKELLSAQKDLDDLLELTRDNPRQFRLSQQFKDNLTVIDHDTQLAYSAFKKGDLVQYKELRKRVAELARTLIDPDFVSMAKDEQEIQELSESRESQRRLQVKLVLLAVVPFSIAFSIVLAFVASKILTRRVEILEQNSARLARGEVLSEPIGGDDEVSAVDFAMRKMAKGLAESTLRERALLDNCRAVLCSLDKAGRLTSINKAASQVFDYSQEQLLGRYLVDLVELADRQKLSELIQAVVAGQGVKAADTRMRARNGRLVDVSVSADWSQRTESVVCVVHDVTERKDAERTQRQFTDFLAVGLRHPLSTICTIHESLERDVSSGAMSREVAPFLVRAKQASARMLSLISDLIDVERIEAGSLKIAKSNVSVKALFDLCASVVSGLAKERGCTIETDPKGTVAFADPDRLLQVLINLTSNAVKFSPSGATVSLIADEEPNNRLTIKVVDRGRGIPAGMANSIFERFKQVEIGDAAIGGSGLGLSICKSLIELHDGSITVESEEGKGSTFIVSLPRPEVDAGGQQDL